MSVLVKGMKMPQNCTICRFCVPEADPENGEMCMATGKYVPPCNTDRLENCPLVEVPTPHGQLIDADDAVALLRAHKQESMSKGLLLAADEDAIMRWLDKLPTIIEAEEGEDDE